MGKDQQAKLTVRLAMGELALFLLAWMLGLFAALNGGPAHSGHGNDIASSANLSNLSDVFD